MHINRLIRIPGRSGPFWRLSVGDGRGSLTFFARSLREVMGKYATHCRTHQRELALKEVRNVNAA